MGVTAGPYHACTIEEETTNGRPRSQFRTEQRKWHSYEFPREQAGGPQERVPLFVLWTACPILQCLPETDLLTRRDGRFLAENGMSQPVSPSRIIAVAE